ncbi:MAG: hypothetical protein ABIV47_00635 [Roseiflexaceae bacterium]
MSDQPPPKTLHPKLRLLVTIGVIALGLAIAVFFGMRTVTSARQFEYIRRQGLDRGSASVDAIRPWMTVRFIAVAYAVPEEYIYSALEIPFDRRRPDNSLGEINREFQMGKSPNNELAIIDKTKVAINAYRENPVATGLRDVRPWMSIRYIANSTDVPEQDIFAAIGISATDNQNKPLDLLEKEQHYPGGPRALFDAVTSALAQHKDTP